MRFPELGSDPLVEVRADLVLADVNPGPETEIDEAQSRDLALQVRLQFVLGDACPAQLLMVPVCAWKTVTNVLQRSFHRILRRRGVRTELDFRADQMLLNQPLRRRAS